MYKRQKALRFLIGKGRTFCLAYIRGPFVRADGQKALYFLRFVKNSPYSGGPFVWEGVLSGEGLLSRRVFCLFTVLFTCKFQKTACRLPKFPRTHSSAALLCVVVAKKQCEQILATVHARLYASQILCIDHSPPIFFKGDGFLGNKQHEQAVF